MSPIQRVLRRRDTQVQKSYLDSVADKILQFSTPNHKRDTVPKSTLHLEPWDETSTSGRNQHEARIPASIASGNPPSTLAIEEAPTRVFPRQYAETSTIPAYYGGLYSSPSPGAVVGITLGAVAGFILILFLIYTCINLGGYSTAISESGGTASVVTRRSRHHYRSSRHSEVEVESGIGGGHRSRGGVIYKHRRSSRRRDRSRSRSRSTSSAGDESRGGETVEIRRTTKTSTSRDHRGREHGHGHGDGIPLQERHRSRSGHPHPHGEPVAQRIVVEERRRSTRRQSRKAAARESRSPPRPIVVEASEPSLPHERERIVVEEDVSSVSSPPGPPRRRRSSGYREVRPDEFAGGGETLREVRRSRSISRHRE